MQGLVKVFQSQLKYAQLQWNIVKRGQWRSNKETIRKPKPNMTIPWFQAIPTTAAQEGMISMPSPSPKTHSQTMRPTCPSKQEHKHKNGHNIYKVSTAAQHFCRFFVHMSWQVLTWSWNCGQACAGGSGEPHRSLVPAPEYRTFHQLSFDSETCNLQSFADLRQRCGRCLQDWYVWRVPAQHKNAQDMIRYVEKL